MKELKIKLPSNKKFGYFFTFLFALVTTYFFNNSVEVWAYFFLIVAVIFFIITITKAEILSPLNKIWMRFGLMLGLIISPLVVGLIFFCIFTPLAFLMRLSGRDELRLKIKNKTSHWIPRDELRQGDFFRRQF
tara:strand:+ start:120 stop:518 length:399 start_codon:yes stop_codon:yes gene_type:complete